MAINKFQLRWVHIGLKPNFSRISSNRWKLFLKTLDASSLIFKINDRKLNLSKSSMTNWNWQWNVFKSLSSPLVSESATESWSRFHPKSRTTGAIKKQFVRNGLRESVKWLCRDFVRPRKLYVRNHTFWVWRWWKQASGVNADKGRATRELHREVVDVCLFLCFVAIHSSPDLGLYMQIGAFALSNQSRTMPNYNIVFPLVVLSASSTFNFKSIAISFSGAHSRHRLAISIEFN